MIDILIINSSRRKGSNSSALSAQVAEGAREAGRLVETVEIAKLDIKPCRHCDACRRPLDDFCVIDDDLRPILPKLAATETVIFASPIFWFHLCGQIKQLIDRTYALAFRLDEHGHSPMYYKKIGAVLSFGDPPLASGFMGAVRSLQEICEYTGARWAGQVCGNFMEAGLAARDEEAMGRARAFGRTL